MYRIFYIVVVLVKITITIITIFTNITITIITIFTRCLLGTFSLLLVALAFAQLSIASLIYFKVTYLSIL